MDYAGKYDAVADIYDSYVKVDYDIPFWIEECLPAGEVLELAAGTGRITLPLARAGVRMTALDVSEELLAQLREKAAKEGLGIEAVRADMRSFELHRQFPLVILPFHSIAELVEPADHRATFHSVYAHLVDGGRFVVPIHNPTKIRASAGSERLLGEFTHPANRNTVRFYNTTTISGHLARNEQRYDEYNAGRMVETRTFVNIAYLFEKAEFQSLAQATGFAIESVCGDYDRSPVAQDSPYLIYGLRK